MARVKLLSILLILCRYVGILIKGKEKTRKKQKNRGRVKGERKRNIYK